MKKRNWIYVLLILLTVAAFWVYRKADDVLADHQAPKITFSDALLEISVVDHDDVLLQGVTATDDRDGDVTASVVVEKIRLLSSDGTISVTYAAFDAAGHITKAERQARYTDYESPRFSLNRTPTFSQNSGVNTFDIVSAGDMIDGDISHRVRITSMSKSSLSTPGSHEVELRVSNSLGETVKLIIPLEVYASGTYNASVELTDYLVYLPVGAEFDAESYLDTFSRSGVAVSLANGVPETYTLRIDGEVDTTTPGVYAVDYRISEPISTAGSYNGYARLIVVVEG